MGLCPTVRSFARHSSIACGWGAAQQGAAHLGRARARERAV